jgi:hypothetical protein
MYQDKEAIELQFRPANAWKKFTADISRTYRTAQHPIATLVPIVVTAIKSKKPSRHKP